MTAPMVVTERLELWRPQAADLDGLARLLAPDAVREYLGGAAPSLADTFARLTRNAGSWALYGYGTFVVRERGARAVVGSCGVFHSWRGFDGFDGFDDAAEAGWIFAPPVWGRGHATEATAAALQWFDRMHGPRRVVCMIDPHNHASHKLAARLGFAAFGQQVFEGEPITLLQRGV
jgi:RimJ/RimL family protein N-acetyltransferase